MHSGARKRMLVLRLMHIEYCAKRWQTREGTYQLKRRRLLPDVRDPPEREDAEVDMTDIWLWLWRRCFLFGFTKAIVCLCRFMLLRHRCCLYDFTRALFCNPASLCGRFPSFFLSACCFSKMAFCMFLS